jgi:glycosyltransferase involved in cell wall biosynthesis
VATNQNVMLILVGEGDQRNELEELAKKLDIEKNVVFAGRYEHVALYAWYPVADYFILPSTFEPFGAVVNESLIAGVPVLCSALAGASSLINGKNGRIFNPFDTSELVSVFNEVFGSEKNMHHHVAQLRQSLMPFTFDERFGKLASFLELTIHDK